MIISRTQVQNLLKNYAKVEKKPTDATPDQKGSSLEDVSNAYQIARKIINNAPEIREERLADIKQAIKTGTYSVTDEEIAEKMISRSLVDKLV